MKTYKVSVNDKEYIVKLEEVDADTAVAQSAPPPRKRFNQLLRVEKVKDNCAFAGVILKLHVQPGTAVKSGDIVLIIEAMKLENEVVAPRDGVVQVFVKEGQTVDAEDALTA